MRRLSPILPDAHGQLPAARANQFGAALLEPALDPDRRHDRPARVILVGDRRAEQRHEPVAKELIDRPFVLVHLGERQLEEPVQEAVHRLGPQLLGHWSRVRNVAEEHCHLLPLSFEGAPGREDFLG
jgi:hypothetical protein